MIKRSLEVTIFAGINLFLAAQILLLLLLFMGAMIFGIFFSGDPPDEILKGILGFIVFFAVFGVYLAVYLVAGIGLLKLKKWGYYAMFVAAIMSSCSCVGLAYTVLAFVFGLKDDFKAQFFGAAEPGSPGGPAAPPPVAPYGPSPGQPYQPGPPAVS
jgi:hypothetical protein